MRKFRKAVKDLEALAEKIQASIPPDPLNRLPPKVRRALEFYNRSRSPQEQWADYLRNENPFIAATTEEGIPGSDDEDIEDQYKESLEVFNTWWTRRQRIRDARK